MCFRDIVRQLLPPLVLIEHRIMKWHEAPASPDEYAERLRAYHEQANKYKDSGIALRAFVERLREEHQRLESIENKSRAVLGASTLLVAFATFGSTVMASAHDAMTTPLRALAV